MIYNYIKLLKPTFTKLLLVLTITITGATNAQSELLKDSILKKYIDQSVLVFQGKLIEKYSREENFKNYTINRDRVITESSTPRIFTTYVFEVIEVLKGKYSKKTIKVIRKGGCSKKLDKCIKTTLDYDYSLNQVGVMFLNYRYKSTIYKSIGSYRTALILTEDDTLVSQRSFEENLNSNKITANKKGEIIYKSNLKLSHLKSLIATVQKSHES